METQTAFDTKPLLRPDQVQSAQEEIKSLEAKLSNPLIQDRGEVMKQLRRARPVLESQTPRPPENSDEEGRMVKRSKELLDDILCGMCSQEEMRFNPNTGGLGVGAVGKHMKWERRNKQKILEWKNLQLRLHPGEQDAANLERHRPTRSTLNMDTTQIPRKQFFMPDTNGPAVPFSDEQISFLRQLSPQLAQSIGLMTNTQRQQVKETIVGIGLAEPSASSVAGKRGVEKREAKKRVLSEAHKAAMKAGREAKAKKKA